MKGDEVPMDELAQSNGISDAWSDLFDERYKW